MFIPTINDIKNVVSLFAKTEKINYTRAKLRQAIMYYECSRTRYIHLSSDQKIDMLQLLKELEGMINE